MQSIYKAAKAEQQSHDMSPNEKLPSYNNKARTQHFTKNFTYKIIRSTLLI